MFGAAWAANVSGGQNPDFARPAPVIDLTNSLAPYHAASAPENDGSRWYLTTVANQAVRPVTRILLAEQPYDAALRLLPRRGRAALRQVATSDADVIVENAHAYGRYAFRVTIPPATSAALAIRIANDDATPRVSAWSESAIAAHKARIEILFAAIAGLIASALAIITGVAVMTGHAAPRWAAVVLRVSGVLLLLPLAAWLWVVVPWRAGYQSWTAARHQQGMYRALAAWAVTDVVVLLVFAR